MNSPSDSSQTLSSTTLGSLDSMFTPTTRQQWVEMAVAGLDTGTGEEALQQLRRTTLEGIPLDVLYDSAEMTVNVPFDSQSINEGTPWDNRLCVVAPARSAADNIRQLNETILQALQGGVTSIELHTHSPEALSGALENVQLEMAPVSLRSGNHYADCAEALKSFAGANGIDADKLYCSFNADPVGVCLTQGPVDTPLPALLADMADFAKAATTSTPLSRSVLVDAAIHHNAGASTVEELHAALATATVYLEAMLDAGVSTTDACRQIVFQVAMDADVVLGVAKLRALRALWQHTLRQIDPQSEVSNIKPAHIVTETSRRFTSRLEPWNNHLRNLSASTAAFLGNANALIVHPHDALQRSDRDTAYDTTLGDRMARNIAIILERECGLAKIHDPMAGAYAVENLTQQLMQHTWQSLASTDTGEGWLDELQSGRWQTRLTHTHRQRVTLMEKEQRVAIGVNRFVQTSETVPSEHAVEQAPAATILTPVREAEVFEQAAMQEVSS